MREQDLKDAYDVNFHGERLIKIPENIPFDAGKKLLRTSTRGTGISEEKRNIPMSIPTK